MAITDKNPYRDWKYEDLVGERWRLKKELDYVEDMIIVRMTTKG